MQGDESSLAAWLHGIVHTIEGDLDNARYWYRKAERGFPGPDAVALPVSDRYRYGVVLGSVLTEDGGRGCNGEVWLQPAGAPVRDVRSIAAARLQNMFRFPQLLPGRYELGVRCFGYQAVRRTVEVRIGQVWRAVVTMHPLPERITG